MARSGPAWLDGEAEIDVDALLGRFEAGLLDPSAFTHRDHVRVGHALLARHRFTIAAERMSTGLRRMLERIGRPDAYHETVTIAFLALIAKRMASPPDGFDVFAARHPALFERDVLTRVHRPERLASPIARRTFVLPD